MFKLIEVSTGTYLIVSPKHSNYAVDYATIGNTPTLVMRGTRSLFLDTSTSAFLMFAFTTTNGTTQITAIGRQTYDASAGIFHIKELGMKYESHWLDGIEQAPEHEAGHIAKAIAEWADGDSVASHLAVGGDYFCTRDAAQKAGDKSIFSQPNLNWLRSDHGFQIISLEERASKCRQ